MQLMSMTLCGHSIYRARSESVWLHHMPHVMLNCPICDKPYPFCRDGVSVCESCGHEVQRAESREEVPCIAPRNEHRLLSALLLFGGIIALFFFPVGTVAGM